MRTERRHNAGLLVVIGGLPLALEVWYYPTLEQV